MRMPHALPIAPPPASPGLLAPQHLLVVDDQRLDRAITAHAAGRMGFRVKSAGSIAETRDLPDRGAVFDFVVLDLALGDEDGLEVLPLIAHRNPATVVVLASGFDGRILAASQRLAASLGVRVAGVLRKPILPTALQRLIGQAPGFCSRTMMPSSTSRLSGSARHWPRGRSAPGSSRRPRSPPA
jgi:DNA-binding NtrC family response regulator